MLKTCKADSGVYMILHVPTDSAYVGSTYVSIGNRWSWHKAMLKQQKHTCEALQALWSTTSSDDWEFVILEWDEENDVRAREDFWMGFPTILLNTVKDATGKTRRWPEETKQKMREGRARYLADNPVAHEALAEKARRQHREGKLGRQTWK
jgi:GIY-YIG catalytic domain